MSTSHPRVSVVVTTYNRSDLLEQTLRSILDQTFTDLEVIVVDNCSTDGTWGFLAGVGDSRVRPFSNANHGVIAVNRNFGIDRAQGEFVAFCDDDDLWEPEKLRLQVALMDARSEVVLCYSNASTFHGDSTLSPRMISRRVERGHFCALLRGNFIPNSSVLVRRRAFDEVGVLSVDGTLREDYEMWMRIALNHELAGLDQALIRYRVHPSNVAGNRAKETLRAMRTLRSVANLLRLPSWLVLPNLAFHFLKYIAYRFGQFR